MSEADASDGGQRGPADNELVEAVRRGETDAYGQLYRRHADAGLAFARSLRISSELAEDIVSEAFTRVLARVMAGGGPTTSFRAYLFTAIRANLVNHLRQGSKLTLTDEAHDDEASRAGRDHTSDLLESIVMTKALANLSVRWQEVLWHVDVEGRTPASLATSLGITPNAVSALVYRARDGLRTAYVQTHMTDTGCGVISSRLADWLRDRLSIADITDIQDHLANCPSCSAALEDVVTLIARFRRGRDRTVDVRLTNG